MKHITYYRNLFAWLLLFIYFLNPFKVYQPYLNYTVNYDYISTVLCENKERPSMECHGKCQLSKELKKTTEEDSKNKSTSSRNIEVEECSEDKINLSPTISLIEVVFYAAYAEKNYLSHFEFSTPPPQV